MPAADFAKKIAEPLAGLDEALCFVWSLFCVALASYPIGILTGFMGAAHLLRQQGHPSTIAGCISLALSNATNLWMFQTVDKRYPIPGLHQAIQKRKNVLPSCKKRLLLISIFIMNAILQTWIERVNAGDLEGALEMYDDSATLLPTFSPQPAITKAAIRAYFESLASKPGLKVRLHPETLNAYRAGEAFECISGHYTFSYEAEGKIQSFAARFTFVINAVKDQPIIHHHSSQVPQPD
ncbi:MAG: DUF4440 domain-containing protein [Desulfobacterales bacterium]